jgi:nucleoid-associated protein Lsr2
LTTKTVITLQDDLDGSEAEESIEFALDGVTFEIDLSAENAELLRSALTPWIDAARRTGGRRQLGKASATPMRRRAALPEKPTLGRTERAAIQKFAEANGYAVPAERGRIAAALVEEWENAGRPD